MTFPACKFVQNDRRCFKNLLFTYFIMSKSYQCHFPLFTLKYCQKMRKNGISKIADFPKNTHISYFF